MKLSLIGPPGSGKGTYARLLNKKYKIPMISVGRLLRKISKNKKWEYLDKRYLSKGKLVPDKVVMKVVKDHLKRKYILDGFPRDLNEAKLFEKVGKLDLVISLKVSAKTSVKRLGSRRQCEKCGEIYSVNVHKMIKCKCGGKLIIRSDDTSSAIRQRLRIFNKETKKVIRFYKEKGLLAEVDGEPSIKEVFRGIERALYNRI